MKILVLNGPNLNMLGAREPGLYGVSTLAHINSCLEQQAHSLAIEISCFQSNIEGELIHRIHQAGAEQVDAILFNPAAYTHSSIALRDALLAVAIPFVEIHLSNVYSRESFRQHSYFSDIAIGVITGFGSIGYELGLQAAVAHINQ